MPTSAPDSFLDLLVRDHAGYDFDWRIKSEAESLLQRLLAMLFPHFGEPGWQCPLTLARCAARLEEDLAGAVGPEAAAQLFRSLPDAYAALLADLDGLESSDPAAQSRDEVMLAYPGFLAVCVHRLAHALPAPLVPRIWSEWAHRQTGIDIHPKAQISAPIIIDHGTGVVIGETTVIGPGVRLYQGVTLGALSVSKDQASAKRHPTIEANVTIYAGATILGGDTVIGEGSVIGGSAWVTRSVPPHSVITRGIALKDATEEAESALNDS
jgi:serine O-acetyltransferase